HRVGRTGRMGREGEAITLYTFREGEIVKKINNLIM
ncbi:MAG: ATP-dependent helicase, partial [Saccharolobus sp.]